MVRVERAGDEGIGGGGGVGDWRWERIEGGGREVKKIFEVGESSGDGRRWIWIMRRMESGGGLRRRRRRRCTVHSGGELVKL